MVEVKMEIVNVWMVTLKIYLWNVNLVINNVKHVLIQLILVFNVLKVINKILLLTVLNVMQDVVIVDSNQMNVLHVLLVEIKPPYVNVYLLTILVEQTLPATLAMIPVFLVLEVLLIVHNVKEILIKDTMLLIVNVGKVTTVINMETVRNVIINVWLAEELLTTVLYVETEKIEFFLPLTVIVNLELMKLHIIIIVNSVLKNAKLLKLNTEECYSDLPLLNNKLTLNVQACVKVVNLNLIIV